MPENAVEICTPNPEPMIDCYQLPGGVRLSHVGAIMMTASNNVALQGEAAETAGSLRRRERVPTLCQGSHRVNIGAVLCSGSRRLRTCKGSRSTSLGEEEVSAKFYPRGPETGRVQSPTQGGSPHHPATVSTRPHVMVSSSTSKSKQTKPLPEYSNQ